MNIEELRLYCIRKKGVEETFPFDENVLVFKVMGKMFALTNLFAVDKTVNLKCDPERAIELREEFTSIQPGYHMSKKHWNTIAIENNEFDDAFLYSLIDHSYDLVVSKLTKKLQAQLNESDN